MPLALAAGRRGRAPAAPFLPTRLPVTLRLLAADREDFPAKPVLIIDDAPDVRDSLAMLLQSYGYRTASAVDGLDAKGLLETQGVEPCLILLDLSMPRMDGFQFRRWQEESPFANVPVIVFSGAFDIDRVRMLTRLPAVRKSADPDTLVRLVRRHCMQDGVGPMAS